MSKNRDLANYGTAALEDASVSATSDSVVKRDASGNVSAVDVYASGNLGVGTSIPSALGKTLNVDGGSSGASFALDGGDNFSVIYTGQTESDPTSFFSNTGFKFATATAKDATGFSEKVRIDSSGNVGIGTSPSYPLHVVGSHTVYGAALESSSTSTTSYNVMRWIQGAGSGAPIGYVGTGGSATGNTGFAGAFGIGTQTANPVTFLTNDTERMRIDSSGDILHGGTAKLSPKALDRGIYIESSGNTSRAGLSFYTNDGNNNYRGVNYLDDATGAFGWDMTLSTGDMKYTWSYLSNEQMRLNNTGNLLIGTTTDNGVDKLQVNGDIRTNQLKTVSATFSAGSSADLQFDSITGTRLIKVEIRNTANTNLNATNLLLCTTRLNIFGGGNSIDVIGGAQGSTGTSGEVTGISYSIVEYSGNKYLRVSATTISGSGTLQAIATIIN